MSLSDQIRRGSWLAAAIYPVAEMVKWIEDNYGRLERRLGKVEALLSGSASQAALAQLQAELLAQAAQLAALQAGRPMQTTLRNLGGTVQTVKGSAGSVAAVSLTNNSGATAWIQLFDAATGAVVLGTTPPVWEFELFSGGMDQTTFPTPLAFASGIQMAATTTEGGSVGSAAGVVAFVQYN